MNLNGIFNRNCTNKKNSRLQIYLTLLDPLSELVSD